MLIFGAEKPCGGRYNMMIKYHKFGLIRFRQCRVHIWLQQCWRRVHKHVLRAHSSHLRQHGIWVQVGEMCRYSRPITLDLVWTQWSPHCVVLTFAFCHLLELSWAWVNFVNTIEMCPNLTYVGNEEFLTQFFWRLSYNETVLVSWANEGMVMQK